MGAVAVGAPLPAVHVGPLPPPVCRLVNAAVVPTSAPIIVSPARLTLAAFNAVSADVRAVVSAASALARSVASAAKSPDTAVSAAARVVASSASPCVSPAVDTPLASPVRV